MATSIGRISRFLACLLTCLLAACAGQEAAQEPSTAKAEQQSGDFTPADIGELDEFVGSACLRAHTASVPLSTLSPDTICDAMFAGLLDSAAEMGRRLTGSKFCVAKDFDATSYREAMVNVLRAGDVTGEAYNEYVLGRLKSETTGKAACDWSGQMTLGTLAEKCRWFHVLAASNPRSKLRALARRLSVSDPEKLRTLYGDEMSVCSGYYSGFMAAGFFEADPESEKAYCSDSIPEVPEGSSDQPMAPRFLALTKGIDAAIDERPASVEESAAPLLFDLMGETFPCMASGQGG